MKKFSIETGLKFLVEGAPFIIISRDNDRVVIENTLNRAREVVSATDIELKFLNGDYIVSVEADKNDSPAISALAMLNEAETAEFNRRCAYIKELIGLSTGKVSRTCMVRVINEVAISINDPCPPSISTAYRWLKVWRDAGENLAALMPRNRDRGPRSMHMRKDAQVLIREALDESFLVRECPTLISVMSSVEETIAKHNEGLDLSEHVSVPSISTLYRFLKTLDPYEVMLKRRGKYAADQYFRNIGKGVTADAPLDIIQIDHTVLDIQVLTSINNIVARPTLTVALDVCTRMPLGVHVGFAAPGYEAVMLCLRNAILPKGKLLASMPEVTEAWPCYGVPRTILLDNGMEFHSEHLKDACNVLGIGLTYHPVKAPHYKGAVERFFGTINSGLLSQLKGKTFSNIQEKGDYDPVANAAIPFKLFQAMLYKWMVDVYARRFHRGIEDFPIEVWKAGVKQYPVDLPMKPEDLLILLSEVKHRTLTNAGIQIDCIRYNSEGLNRYFRRLGKKTKVRVKVDPLDLGCAHVFDEEAQRFIAASAIDEKYIGLSKWQHKVVRKLVQVRRAQGNAKYDISDALREIGAHIAKVSKAGKKKSHKKAARFSGYEGTKNPNVGKSSELPGSPPASLDFDFDGFDASDLLDAVAKAGWSDLNGEDD